MGKVPAPAAGSGWLRAWARRRAWARLPWPDSFRGADFVIVDVETSGWSPDESGITEIGAVRISQGHLGARFSSLVNPGSAIPAPVTALTGISDAMVAGAPALAEVLPGFLTFARGSILTAHNADFDLGFLTAGCHSAGLAWPEFPVLDTLALAHQVLCPGEVPDSKLATLAAVFGSQTRPCHRALPDALATAGVLKALLQRLAAAGGTVLPLQASGPTAAAHRPATGQRPPSRRSGATAAAHRRDAG